MYFQVGPDSERIRLLADLLNEMLYEPAFNTLRTIEQLGYVVETSVRVTATVVGIVVTVQSSKFSVR